MISHPLLATATIATNPIVVLAVDGVLTDVIDLHDETIQRMVGTTISELTGSWHLISPAPTQELGRAAFDSGAITALKYPSAKQANGWALAVVVDRLTLNPANFIEVIDRHRHLGQRLP